MKVALIGRYPLIPDRIVGGVQAVTNVIATALSNHPTVSEVSVITFHQGEFTPEWRQLGSRLRVCYLPGQSRLVLPTDAIFNLHKARRVIAEIAPDIVHGQGIGATPNLATRVGLPCVITVHGLAHIEARMQARGLSGWIRVRLTEAMIRKILTRAHAVISTSEYDARSVQQLARGLHVTIPNPVSLEFFVEPKPEIENPEILFAGVIIRRKNLDGLLRALVRVKQRLPEARLTLVGPSLDPVYAASLPTLAKTLGLNGSVNVVGHIETGELIQRMQRCSVVVLFSHEETSPTIIAQAMAIGKPVVASRVGGIPEMIVDSFNGFLIEPGNESDLADRLIEILRSPGLRTEMSSRSRQIARQRFEPSVVAGRTVDVYRTVLSGNVRI